MPGFGNDQYNIAIQVTAETQQAQASLDQLAVTTGALDKKATPAVDTLDDLAGGIQDVGDAADVTDSAAGGLGLSLESMAGVVTLAITAIAVLATKLYEAWQEHKRLSELASRLDLPLRETLFA